MQKISKEFIEDLAVTINIANYMEDEYDSNFHPSTNNWLNTNCPLPNHEDNSPSFGVNSESNKYHCFGCGATGNIINLVQFVEGLTFVETIQKLSAYSGVEIETTNLDLKYLLKELNKTIEQYLNPETGTKLPGGLSETDFLITFSSRTKKFERATSYKHSEWIDQVYKNLDDKINKGDYKAINLIWKDFAKQSKQKINEQ